MSLFKKTENPIVSLKRDTFNEIMSYIVRRCNASSWLDDPVTYALVKKIKEETERK